MGTMYQQFGKRAMDTVLSFTALVTLSPLLLTTAAAIKLTSPGPVLFKQQRLGLHGKAFTIYKFRSMTVGAEHTGSGVYSGEGDPRVTAVGRFLRKTSIDELPQCVNVLKGDMALVGPRPPLTYHPWPLEQYTEEQLHMFDVRPGITGWAQVNGLRGDTSIRARVDYDLYYIENWSMLFDIKILLMTPFKGVVNHQESLK